MKHKTNNSSLLNVIFVRDHLSLSTEMALNMWFNLYVNAAKRRLRAAAQAGVVPADFGSILWPPPPTTTSNKYP